MTFDEDRECDGLDELDRALAVEMEESRPTYSPAPPFVSDGQDCEETKPMELER